jgi:hypothetical protein
LREMQQGGRLFFGLSQFYIHLPQLLMMIWMVHVTFFCSHVVFAKGGLLHMMWPLPLANIHTTLFALFNCVNKIINVVYVRRCFILNGGFLGRYENQMKRLWF